MFPKLEVSNAITYPSNCYLLSWLRDHHFSRHLKTGVHGAANLLGMDLDLNLRLSSQALKYNKD